MLSVLNVNFNDVVGGQFNNFECREAFHRHHIKPSFSVWDKLSTDKNVYSLWRRGRLRRYVNGGFHYLERWLSVQSLLYPYSIRLFFSKYFRNADVVHYHILHNGWFSLLAMPFLTRRKPSVWTIHDPWLMTGHCVYPLACERWKTGCGHCPQLQLPHALRRDHTAALFQLKKRLLPSLKVDFVVASQWMKNLVESSPIGKDLSLHHIPFGVDLELFKPVDNKDIRRSMGIPDENIVFFFRSNASPYKGVEYIKAALPTLLRQSQKPITLLSVEALGLFDAFIGQCQIIEHLWEHDINKLKTLFQACDIFLMPSTAEAFGMMAVEAMACGKPVIFFTGTALDEVTHAPRAGVGAAMRNADDLGRVMLDLIHDDAKRKRMSKEARKIAEENYDLKIYLAQMNQLYKGMHYQNIRGAEHAA